MKRFDLVLLVDNDAISNFITRLLLESQGIAEQILVAENGLEALQVWERLQENTQPIISQIPPLLILLDINMPIMNGFEFLEAFFEQKRDTAVQIIMLSSSANASDLEKAYQYPISGYLQKPLMYPLLMKLIA